MIEEMLRKEEFQFGVISRTFSKLTVTNKITLIKFNAVETNFHCGSRKLDFKLNRLTRTVLGLS